MYYPRDTIDGVTPAVEDRIRLWALPPELTGECPSYMELFPGMKVIIRENLAFAHNVVNGAIGTICDIIYEEDEGKR